MSENLPYHDEQWDDLPLPNREEAWQKMQRLLDEKDKRRRVLPFWFWRYALLVTLLAGITTGGYFLLSRNTHSSKEAPSAVESVDPQERKQQTTVQHAPGEKKDSSIVDKGTTEWNKRSDTITVQPLAIKEENPGPEKQRWLARPGYKAQSAIIRNSSVEKNSVSVYTIPDREQREAGAVPDKLLADSFKEEKVQETVAQTKWTPGMDTVSRNDSAKVVTTPPADSNETQNKVPKKKSLFVFSAGIGLQQAIAFGGQQTSTYNMKGKQNKASDHIPSVYLRLQKGNYFLQGELHYNTPQPVKSFSFSQVTSYDEASDMLRTERLSVQKLYYHQFPLNINYFVLPQWSVGTGVVYSRFAGAVTGKETKNTNVFTGGETITTQVVPVKGYKDSFLYRSTTGMMLQTDYHWRRFSFGLRYTKNLQPFIKYMQPDGTVLNENNQVLQAILRLRFF